MSKNQINNLRERIESNVLDIKKLSNILGVEPKFIKEVIEKGSLPAIKLGKKYFINENDVYRYFGINVKSVKCSEKCRKSSNNQCLQSTIDITLIYGCAELT